MRTRIPIEEGAEEPRGAALALHIQRKEKNHDYANCSFVVTGTGPGNPRKAMDRNGLEGLAASIRNDGLLQNLVVKPVKGKDEHYRIVRGERRYRALKLLQERGEVNGDYAVPVEIRDSLSKDEPLLIATVENLQRQNLTPFEEAAALTKLIHKERRSTTWRRRQA